MVMTFDRDGAVLRHDPDEICRLDTEARSGRGCPARIVATLRLRELAHRGRVVDRPR